MMCWDGLTVTQAARIGFGLGLTVLAAVLVGLLAIETWIALNSNEEGEQNEEG